MQYWFKGASLIFCAGTAQLRKVSGRFEFCSVLDITLIVTGFNMNLFLFFFQVGFGQKRLNHEIRCTIFRWYAQ